MSQWAACSEALGSRGRLPLAILLLGNRGVDAHINLSLRLRSEKVPYEETPGTGKHTSRSRACGCGPLSKRAEDGRTEDARSPRCINREAAVTLQTRCSVTRA